MPKLRYPDIARATTERIAPRGTHPRQTCCAASCARGRIPTHSAPPGPRIRSPRGPMPPC
eukprot:scaffold174606_cov25-Prasinocladus_malaysianus.AAC.1